MHDPRSHLQLLYQLSQVRGQPPLQTYDSNSCRLTFLGVDGSNSDLECCIRPRKHRPLILGLCEGSRRCLRRLGPKDSLGLGRPRGGQNTLSFGTALHLGRACTILCSVSSSGSRFAFLMCANPSPVWSMQSCFCTTAPFDESLRQLAVHPTQPRGSTINDCRSRSHWKHGEGRFVQILPPCLAGLLV